MLPWSIDKIAEVFVGHDVRSISFAVQCGVLLCSEVARGLCLVSKRLQRCHFLYLFFSFSTLGIAYMVWNLGKDRVICAPESWLQPHACWHILTAVALALMVSVVLLKDEEDIMQASRPPESQYRYEINDAIFDREAQLGTPQSTKSPNHDAPSLLGLSMAGLESGMSSSSSMQHLYKSNALFYL